MRPEYCTLGGVLTAVLDCRVFNERLRCSGDPFSVEEQLRTLRSNLAWRVGAERRRLLDTAHQFGGETTGTTADRRFQNGRRRYSTLTRLGASVPERQMIRCVMAQARPAVIWRPRRICIFVLCQETRRNGTNRNYTGAETQRGLGIDGIPTSIMAVDCSKIHKRMCQERGGNL